MKQTPFFIVFEGIDGSGKSTQCELLFRHVSSLGLAAVRLFEPTDGKWGQKIRKVLEGKVAASPEEQLELFLRDRSYDVEKNIMPALKKNNIVIMDRYYYSNAAYQGAAGVPAEEVILKNRNMRVPEPDRVYCIDLPPYIALQRIAQRNGRKDIFERGPFLDTVRNLFLSLADDSFLVIDGRMKVEEIFEKIRSDFEGLIRAAQ